MTFAQLIELAKNTAIAGTDADNNPILKQSLEAQGIADQAIHELATEIAGNPELRARLEKQFSITITNGVGTIPSGMLTEYLREGSVRDATDVSQFPTGTPFSRVKYATDFFTDSQLLLARYCLMDNQMHACPPGVANYTQFNSTLTADAPFVPTSTNLNTEVPDEVTDELVFKLATRLRGMFLAEGKA